MSGEKATSPCNKFQANIFNKSKCQNCFKSRELHLLNDHDMDQAKPIYGGWLCLAPEGTDFDNPMQRSRKWQRRFFILYEHGSLTFALDELPSTLPQGTVNLNLCSEVTDAEAKTGQRNALWITTPEQDIYIRGENKEIIHGWCDQLVVYPRTNKQNQKKKRKVCPVSTQEPSPAKMAATNPCFPGVGREAGSSLWQEEQPVRGLDITSVWPVTDSDPSSPDQPPAGNISRYLSPVSREPLASGGSWLCSSISSSVSSLESVTSDPGCDGRPAEPNDVRASTSDENRRAEGSHRDREGSPTGFEPANPGWVEDGVVSRKGRSEVRASTREKLQSCGDMQQLSSPAPPPQRRAKSLDRRTSESIMTPDLLNFKKGWMVKSDKEGQWKKFWFVLSADSLRYFKDSIAEEASDLEGEIDLTKCYNVSEYQVQRNYGFQVHTQRGIYTLSAMTTGIRRNWIQALMKNVHPSHAPDVASLPGHHIPSSPSEVLPKPDVTQESPSKVPTETDRRPKPRSVLERRREGRYRTFDWAEFRPLAKPPTEAETRRGAKDPCGQLESIDRERKKRREERRRRYESMLGLPLAWELLGDCRTREDSDRASSPRSQQRAQEEMEQCWQLVENTAFRLEKTVPLHPEAPTEDTVELEGLLDNYRKRVEDLKAELAESDRLRLELEAQLNTAGCHQTQVPTLLDPPLSPESDFGPLTSHETSHEMSLSSHTQSLRDMYRETKALLHQQDLIRQDMQEQLGLVLSIPAPLQDHNSPGGQTPSIWLHDADGNIQDLGDLLPESCVPVDTPLLSPISDGQCSPPQSEASDSDSGATDPQTDLDGDVRQRAHSPETQTLISIEWSPDSLAMDETGGESAGDSEGDGLNRCEPLSCAEGHMAQDQAVVRRLSQEVVLLASQNEALNQRNQEMLNQLTEADREIERLKAELVSSSRHPGDPHHLSEADQLNQTRAECLERELSKRNQQLQEAQSLIASLEERLRGTETQLQLRQATLQGLGVPAGTEEEGDENTDALLYEKKAEGYLLRCFEATEAKLTELERQLRQSERTCGELLANNMEFREIERLYSQRATEAEADIRRLNAELENERLGEGDKLIVGNTVSVDERVQQVIEGMVMMLHALGKLLQVVDRSDYRMIKGSIESGHEEEKQAKTVVSQLKWEEEFWEVMLTGLKGDPSLLSKEKRMDTLLSEVAERMVAEKQMLLLAHDLFSETDSCRDSGRGGREGMCESGSLKDLDIIGNIASDSEPEDTENDDNDDNRWILDSNQQHGNTDKNISRHFTELTQTKISLLNHIASSVRASANENLRSMAHRLCDFHSSEHPWSDFIHSAAIEALYSYHISRLHSSYRRELEETKQRLLASSLICSDCAGLRGENIELRTRLSDLEERWNASTEAEISTLSQMEATDAELWDGGTDDQRVDNTAGSVTGEMEEENPGHESTAEEEEDIRNVETPENMLEDYAMPDHMEMSLLSDEGHRAIREKMAAENIEIIDEDREETYSVGLEDIVLLRDRVKDLEGQLSALVDEMKVELEGTITSLQLQHEKDIEKLKGAYEQGFITMEDSHQRAVEELQHRQQRELERLLEDRDSLLEEETAATITAIAAIKNAHRLELQREVQKRCQSNNSTGSADLEEICRQHSEELASCQRELEAVSEQYSLKCLENGHFSQALDTDRKALCQCQQENQDLRTRNQELSGDLAAEVTRLCSLAQQDALPLSQGMDVYELEITLRVKESEVQCLKQELASLKDELQSAQRDKRLVGKKYKDIYAELTTMRAKADRDVGQLEENLRLAHQALGETSP